MDAILSQKRENYRLSIRKLRTEDYFNAKRFSILANTTTTQMSAENTNSDTNFDFSPLFEQLLKWDPASPHPNIHGLQNYLYQIAHGVFKNMESFCGKNNNEMQTKNNNSEVDNMQKMKKEGLETFNEINQGTMIPGFQDNRLKKVENETLFDMFSQFNAENAKETDFVVLLLGYCFKYLEEMETAEAIAFCFLLEKLILLQGDLINLMVKLHVVEKLRDLLRKKRTSRDITESVFFCFTRISAIPEYISHLINNDVILEILITLMLNGSSLVLAKIISWLTYNLTTGAKEALAQYYVFGRYLFSICGQMLELSVKEIVTCNLASIFCLIQEDKLDDFCFNKDFLINEKTHVLELVNKCFARNDEDIILGAVKIVYKVSLGKEDHVKLLYEKGLVDSLLMLLTLNYQDTEENQPHKPSLQKEGPILNEKIVSEMLITLNNVIDTPDHLINCLNKNLLSLIFSIFQGNSSLELKKECVILLASMTICLNYENWGLFARDGAALGLFCEAVDIFNETKVLKLSILGVKNIVIGCYEDKEKLQFCKGILEEQGFDMALKTLEGHQVEEICLLAMDLVEMLNY